MTREDDEENEAYLDSLDADSPKIPPAPARYVGTFLRADGLQVRYHVDGRVTVL